MGVAMTGVVIPSFVVAPPLVMIFAITSALAAGRRLERRGAEIYDPADGGAFPAYIRQHRAYHPQLND